MSGGSSGIRRDLPGGELTRIPGLTGSSNGICSLAFRPGLIHRVTRIISFLSLL